ncbi:hypothetical protein BK809_0005222 [Diplodia seriata]|uniref:Uncharacterized protein n=1 Tax=Diplodia seriata TaxID=420778 RepID=A0A1S8B9B9_9PEZI|nr:hypothetical protein BK809_0005222 [Diplodia seriata]
MVSDPDTLPAVLRHALMWDLKMTHRLKPLVRRSIEENRASDHLLLLRLMASFADRESMLLDASLMLRLPDSQIRGTSFASWRPTPPTSSPSRCPPLAV